MERVDTRRLRAVLLLVAAAAAALIAAAQHRLMRRRRRKRNAMPFQLNERRLRGERIDRGVEEEFFHARVTGDR